MFQRLNQDCTAISVQEEEREFIQEMLDGVSRSFAAIIPLLEEPFDRSVGLAYLLCRVCDNIEDCTNPFEWKQKRFEEFRWLLRHPTQSHEILQKWHGFIWEGLKPAELALQTTHGERLWSLFAALPPASQDIIRKWSEEMSLGMEEMQAPNNALVQEVDDIQALIDLTALNRYCYYVAGTVGHMCTELAAEHYGFDAQQVSTLKLRCETFGNALQKTNIFKDFEEDLTRGVSFFPKGWLTSAKRSPLALKGADNLWIWRVLSHILDDLSGAVHYITHLPYEAQGYKQFCLCAILPAYETLVMAAGRHPMLFTPEHACKIPRTKMFECLQMAEAFSKDNEALLSKKKNYEEQIFRALFSAGKNGALQVPQTLNLS